MPYDPVTGVYTAAAGALTAAAGQVIASATWNGIFTDLQTGITALGAQTIAITPNLLGTEDQVLAGGAFVTAKSLATGNITIDCGARPLQYITNGGAFTITAPLNDGSCMVLVTNNASAGVITFSGFSVGLNTGDTLTTTNTNKFTISIWRINGTSGYRILAHQ